MEARIVRKHMTTIANPMERLRLLEDLSGCEIHELINARANRVRVIAQNSENGMIGIMVESIDCDRTHGTTYRIMPVTEVEGYLASVYDNREGPTSHLFLKPSRIRSYDAIEAYVDRYEHDLAVQEFANNI